MAALEADDHVGAAGEPVDDLALAFVAPLGADDGDVTQTGAPSPTTVRPELVEGLPLLCTQERNAALRQAQGERRRWSFSRQKAPRDEAAARPAARGSPQPPEQRTHSARIALPHVPGAGAGQTYRGMRPMKTTTILAIALGVGALAACNKSPTEQAAENVESNYGNAAENIESATSNAGEAIESNASNAASEVKAAGANTAAAIKNEGKEEANAVRNGTATSNSM